MNGENIQFTILKKSLASTRSIQFIEVNAANSMFLRANDVTEY